jgi:hypothetical protein
MIKLKILSAVVILSTAIAAPVFAQDAGPSRPHRAPVYDQSNFGGAYDRSNEAFDAQPLTNEERRNLEDFGFSGRWRTLVSADVTGRYRAAKTRRSIPPADVLS